MSIIFFPVNFPCIYTVVAIILTIYYASRAPFIQSHYHGKDGWSRFELLYVLYVQDIIYNVVCSVSGFLSIYALSRFFQSTGDLANLSGGSSVAAIFLALLGLTGASGQLPFLLTHGRFPKGN